MKELLLCACVGLLALWVNSTVAPAFKEMVAPAKKFPTIKQYQRKIDSLQRNMDSLWNNIDSLENDSFADWDIPPMSTYNNR